MDMQKCIKKIGILKYFIYPIIINYYQNILINQFIYYH
jgi:hypothetical protein